MRGVRVSLGGGGGDTMKGAGGGGRSTTIYGTLFPHSLLTNSKSNKAERF